LKMINNFQLIIGDHHTPGQRPHIDSTVPTIDTFLFFDTDDDDVDCTVFHRTVNENGEFGEIEELLLHQKRWDHRYALPWTDENIHPILSPSKVPNVTIALSSGGVIHRGPKPTTKGKRFVVYFSATVIAVNVDNEDFSANTNEVTYAYGRFRDEEQHHHIIAEACQRYGNDWRKMVSKDDGEEIDGILTALNRIR
jgi:hypothetical protein